MAIKKEKNKHLTDDLRLALEAAIRERKSFSQIKRELGIPRSTIKREIMNHRVESTKVFCGHRFNPCVHRIGCKATGMCARPDCSRLCAFCGIGCSAQSCQRIAHEGRRAVPHTIRKVRVRVRRECRPQARNRRDPAEGRDPPPLPC